MPEAEVLYDDVMFAEFRGNTEGIISSSTETTYSEVMNWKTPNSVPSTEQPASQHVESNRGSKVTSDRALLLALSVLLTAAVIALSVVSFEYVQTKNKLHDALRRNLTDEPCQKCEEGWELHGGQCYYFSNNRSPWKESRDECVRHGGDLVKIDSREEQTFLEKRLRNKMDKPEDKFWIGLTDSQEEGRWLWADGSELDKSLSFWIRTEPDNYNGNHGENPDGEDCASMGEKAGAADLKCWFDQLCNDLHKRICEKAAQTGRYTCPYS